MPDPRSVLRLLALAVFLLLVAVGLWLLDASWPLIIVVMVAAWALAAVVEWAAWRQQRYSRLVARPQSPVVERPAEAPVAPQEAELAAPAEGALSPPAEEEATPPPPKHELVPEPPLPPPRRERPPKGERQPRTPLQAPPPTKPPLRPVPQPPPPPPAPPTQPPAARAASPPGVVDLRRRATAQPRQWNLWDLERLARDELQQDPGRFQELSYLFVHLRQFASADGALPIEFDPLVRESLGDLLELPR